jgi:hypothetical protein
MSKKKNNKSKKQELFLSPMKYVRLRSRNLPIDKCWVNDKWQDLCDAIVIVSRKHSSETITSCIYQVDLCCMGVTDTMFLYNDTGEELEAFLRSYKEDNINFSEIPYNLAHNIIFAAVEFADEYGFKPHHLFTEVTQYFLEEDNDDIPIIEVKCGDLDGFPCYVASGNETVRELKQIYATLERTAGPGNFSLWTDEEDEYDDDDYDDEEYDNEEYDNEEYDDEEYDNEEYDDEDENDNDYEKHSAELRDEHEWLKGIMEIMSDEELKTSFTLIDSKDEAVKRDIVTAKVISDILIERNIESDKVSEYEQFFRREFEVEIIDMKKIPNSFFLGVPIDNFEDLIVQFGKLARSLYTSNFDWALKKFENAVGETPVSSYFEILHTYFLNRDDIEYNQLVEKYYHKYPDYFLFQTLYFLQLASAGDKEASQTFKSLLKNTPRPITQHELNEYLCNYAKNFITQEELNMNRTFAFELVAKSLVKENQNASDRLESFMYLSKYLLVQNFCKTGKTYLDSDVSLPSI